MEGEFWRRTAHEEDGDESDDMKRERQNAKINIRDITGGQIVIDMSLIWRFNGELMATEKLIWAQKQRGGLKITRRDGYKI